MTDSISTTSLKKLDLGTLIACCLAVAAAQLCITVPSPINGEIQAAFGASGSQVAWVTSAFILPTAILELNFGVVGDLFGRKRLLVLGGLVLAFGELLNATSQNITMMWTGQALAGVGAAALFPSSLAVIAAATPDGKDRAKAVSTWALSISLASAVGPLTGMASGATSLVREFGQGLGPAVISTIAMSAASSALVGKLGGADAGMEAAAGPLAVVNAGSDSARAAARTALGHGMALGVVICGCASLLGALVTLLLVRKNTARAAVGAGGEASVRTATA